MGKSRTKRRSVLSESRKKFNDRTRFNWGYWNGRSNYGRRHVSWAENHFDKVYGAGFFYGMNESDGNVTVSSFAWKKFQDAKKTITKFMPLFSALYNSL